MAKYYSKTHEWAVIEGDEATIGISAYAAKELGDITYVELPKVSSDVIVGDSVGVVESVKAASDVYSPLSGTVNAVNKNLEDDPGLVSNSPEENGWIYKLENIDLDELEDLMSEEDYAKYLKTL
ncbi:MAG: glycine cleavage system protein GcvH [Lentisphaeria bacterium]|nr:glycine cleavage system protein GcvH [Lentisphaeria bacterium]